MIEKKKEDFLFHEGEGRPHMLERMGPGKSPEERRKVMAIDLSDLNHEGKGPVNYPKRAGRLIESFVTSDEADDGDEFDIK